MSEIVLFEENVNESLSDDRLLMDDKDRFPYFFNYNQDDISLNDDDMNGIFKKNINSTDFKSDNNNIFLSPDNQLKKEKDMNKLKENEEKHMNDIKEESKLKYNKDGTLQKKRGRKKLNEEINEEDIIHKKTDTDNIIYKLKVNCLKCIRCILNALLMKNGFTFKFQKINGKIVKDTKRNSNLDFLNKKISEILKMERSGRYRPKNIQTNENIIEQIEFKKIRLENKPTNENIFELIELKKINEILEMRFIDFFQDIYMKKKSEEFETQFGVKCELLFLETTFDKDKTRNEEQKKIMSKLNDYGLIQYFEDIIPRKPKKKNLNE